MHLQLFTYLFVLTATAGVSAQQATSFLQADRPSRWERHDRLAGIDGPEFPERDEIETDRDSFTPATSTTGRGRLIAETAYSYSDNRQFKEGHSFPELLLRYGATERLELRLGWNYEIGGVPAWGEGGEVGFSTTELEREGSFSYGLKYQLTRASAWMPDSALILSGLTPTSGPSSDTHLVATYVFGWEFANRWKLDAALRYATGSEQEDRFQDWAPSVVLKVPVGERINVHAEYFGVFSSGKEDEISKHFLTPGVHYLLTENCEIGVRVGWGLNDHSSRFFVNTGLGVRF